MDDRRSRSSLSGDERKTLQRWARRHSSSQALALRCRIVLACAEGDRTHAEIAAELGCNPVTVSKWRHRFAARPPRRAGRRAPAGRGPHDRRRRGRSGRGRDPGDRTAGCDALVDAWAGRQARDLPHHGGARSGGRSGSSRGARTSFKVSPDPDLVEKIRDLVALYMNPPVAAAVFAVDEKPQIQALNRTAPTLPMLPTTPARATHDYERNGTCDLFAALEIATGKVITDIRARHTSADFVAFLNKVNRNVPADFDVHVILDNLSTHKTPTVHSWLLRHRRFHFHFTPTYGSWMNLVERWFSALTTKKLQRSAHRSVKELAADIQAWAANWNENPTPFVWHKTAEQILERLAGYCAAINQDATA